MIGEGGMQRIGYELEQAQLDETRNKRRHAMSAAMSTVKRSASTFRSCATIRAAREGFSVAPSQAQKGV